MQLPDNNKSPKEIHHVIRKFNCCIIRCWDLVCAFNPRRYLNTNNNLTPNNLKFLLKCWMNQNSTTSSAIELYQTPGFKPPRVKPTDRWPSEHGKWIIIIKKKIKKLDHTRYKIGFVPARRNRLPDPPPLVGSPPGRRTALPAVCGLPLTGPRSTAGCAAADDPARPGRKERKHAHGAGGVGQDATKLFFSFFFFFFFLPQTRAHVPELALGGRSAQLRGDNTIVISPRPSSRTRLLRGISRNFITEERVACACAQLPCGRYWASVKRMRGVI